MSTDAMKSETMDSEMVSAPRMQPDWSLWVRQFIAIYKIEFRKAAFTRRAYPCLTLAALPVLILSIAAWESATLDASVFETIENAREIYGQIFSLLMLSGVVFLGTASIFTTLLRGEVLDQSIHYYLLSPVRRGVIVLAKFTAGLSFALALFGLMTLIGFLLLYPPFGMGQLISDITNGIAIQQMGQYLGIIFLASMGYGSVFLATSLLFRNPLFPLVLIVGWETIHFILPPTLKLFSVIHYLKGLLPIPLDEGPLAVIVAPPPVWVSIVGMFALCAVMLFLTVQQMKRHELRYTDE